MIRVEDNQPSGARFTIEVPAILETDSGGGGRASGGGGGMKQRRILVVDDEPAIRQSLGGVLEDEGYTVSAVESGESCLAALPGAGFELVLLDIWLPGVDGLEVLARIQEVPFTERPEVVIISGHGSIEAAVKATKLGAFDFLEKPLSLDRVLLVVKNALAHRSLSLENVRLKGDSGSRWRIIGESVPMKALRQQLSLMAGTNGRVLIFGESGTGKELVAHAIHAMSPRLPEAFVEVNCAAIPEELIESELFGHSKGSFTSAHENKAGKFQKADGGTLFLDEVGDMSLRTQAKVLRALEEQRFEPVGAAESVQVDVRVVAATNKNLEEEIERGNFREDLFYRLNVIPFFVPPLRERREDIPLLADHFLRGVHDGLRAQTEGDDARGLSRAERVSLAGERARAEEPDRADRDPEPAGAGGCAAHSAERDAAAAGASARPLREPAGSAGGGGAGVHSQEARRDERECDAYGRAAGVGAEQLVPEDADAGDRAEGVGIGLTAEEDGFR